LWAYQGFKADLAEFSEVGFDFFRSRVLPLASRTAWSPDEEETIRGLVATGAEYALFRLFGPNHPTAKKVLGERAPDPYPVTKSSLVAQLKGLTKNCQRAAWPPQRFISFARYLDSTMSLEDLAAEDRAREVEAALARGATSLAAANAHLPPPPEVHEDERDDFAETYRAANLTFKRVVNTCLADGAREAASRMGLAAPEMPPVPAAPIVLKRSAAAERAAAERAAEKAAAERAAAERAAAEKAAVEKAGAVGKAGAAGETVQDVSATAHVSADRVAEKPGRGPRTVSRKEERAFKRAEQKAVKREKKKMANKSGTARQVGPVAERPMEGQV
jgi:hypothetical protein